MVENTRKEVFKKVGELENRVNGKQSMIFFCFFDNDVFFIDLFKL